MSCPHPNGPSERQIGDFVELVCRDCHARLAVEDPEPVEESPEAIETPESAPKRRRSRS